MILYRKANAPRTEKNVLAFTILFCFALLLLWLLFGYLGTAIQARAYLRQYCKASPVFHKSPVAPTFYYTDDEFWQRWAWKKWVATKKRKAWCSALGPFWFISAIVTLGYLWLWRIPHRKREFLYCVLHPLWRWAWLLPATEPNNIKTEGEQRPLSFYRISFRIRASKVFARP